MKKIFVLCLFAIALVAVASVASSCRAQRKIAFNGNAVSCTTSGCDTIKYHVTLDEVYTGVKKNQ